jgi:ABC-2 type transport system ATP-binding protein
MTSQAPSGAGDAGDRRNHIVLDDVSKFYGEVLGVNRVNLEIPPGITGLVGPNGSGKTTMMNLLTGLLRPTSGRLEVLGCTPDQPEEMFRRLGYSTQFDAFPRGLSGYQFIYSYLRVHGFAHARADEMTMTALERVGMVPAAKRRVDAYSKGMRQRIKLAQAIAHRPPVMVLDEPLNGLDPMARAEVIALFEELAHEGLHVIISSHILHEVDMFSDRVILLSAGYVVAEGDIRGVRTEMHQHPIQVFVRCDRPEKLAMRLFEHDHVVEVKIHDDRQGLHVRTRDPDGFHLLLNRLVVEDDLKMEAVGPADEDVAAVYQYLIGSDGASL